MKKEQFAVLFGLEDFGDARKIAENILNEHYNIKGNHTCDTVTAAYLAEKLKQEYKLTDDNFIIVMPISDFQDMWNDNDKNDNDYNHCSKSLDMSFITFVTATVT